MKKSDRKGFWKGSSILLLSSVLILGIIEDGGTLVQAAEQKSDKILSEQEAIKFAKKWMDVPAGFEYGYGQYVEPYEELRTPYGAWGLYWSHPNQAFITYKIHPVSGRLLGYSYHDEYSRANGAAIMNSKRALEEAMLFLKKVLTPEELSNLSEPEESVNKGIGYYFEFQRVENGIPFKQNWIAVNTRGDGKVLGFKRIWSEGEMPDTTKIISEKKARELLEQNTKPTMHYKRVYSGKDESKYMLVYDYLPTDPQFVDAITGEMIDAKGRLAKPSPIKGLKEMPLVSAPTEGKGMNGVLTLEQAEASAIHFLQTTYPDRLADIYMLDSQPYYVESYDGSQRWEDHHVNFGWLKNGILIGDRDSNFSLFVNPRTGESGYGKEPLAPPVIDDNDKQRVDMATAKKTEQAMKKSLELYYFQPENDVYEDEEPKPRLVYRLSGDGGVVDAHTGKWISYQ
ncbi:YcdB/YcdC domain-containing protein [uncultured Brevibacillus sp.]|uniref:YcdB/YcdC domain-containing protein n=1 Tax=uncultured Brevibacillus sp. TaxID=169970 RepID=UPI002599A11D|nr:YcdB/YcdC domain-containing protein [uncultured Brevibacillus sp.]